MATDISYVRRNILIVIAFTIVFAVTAFVLLTPLIIQFSPQGKRVARANDLICAPFLALTLLALIHRYLRPIAQLAAFLRKGQTPPPDLAQRARTRAFSAPFYLFVIVLVSTCVTVILSDVFGLIFIPNYDFVAHFSKSLLVISLTIALTLFVLTASRHFLRPVLFVTADLASDVGRRYEIRFRLIVFVVSLCFIIYFFLGVFAFNLIYQQVVLSVENRLCQWGQDLASVAHQFEQDELIDWIKDAEITQDRELFVVDGTGKPLVNPSLADDFVLPQSLAAPTELREENGERILLINLKRPDGTWWVGLTFTVSLNEAPILRRTLVILAGFGLVVSILALLTSAYMSHDITRDLEYVTQRMFDIARHDQASDKIRSLSLDKVGDLIAAFNEVQDRVTAQQSTLARHQQQLLALRDISQRVSAIVELNQIWDTVIKETGHQLGYKSAAIWTVGQDNAKLYLGSATDDWSDQLEQSSPTSVPDAPATLADSGTPVDLVGYVAATREPMLLPDMSKAPFVITGEDANRSAMAVPLTVGDRLIGVFCVSCQRLNAFDTEDVQVLVALTKQIAITIENARLLQQAQANAQTMTRRTRNLLMINRISATLALSLDASAIFSVATRSLVELIDHVNHSSVLVFDPSAVYGQIVAEYPDLGATNVRLPLKNNPTVERILETRRPLVVSDVTQDPIVSAVREELLALDIHALLVVPLIARDKVIGSIGLDVIGETHQFTEEEVDLCQTVAAQAAIAASNARLLYDLRQQSQALTRKSLELSEESSKLDAILRNIADGLVVTDRNHRIILTNPAFKNLVNVRSEKLLRRQLLSDVFPIADLQALVGDALAHPDPHVVAVIDLNLPDQRVIKATSTALRLARVPEIREAGQVAGVVTVLRDITHQVEVDRMKTDFVSAVSHELRTPLTSILGFANLIRRDFQRRIAPIAQDKKSQHAADRILENLTIIEAESQRLTRLINDVLDIAKMQAGRTEWQMTSVDLAQMVDKVASAMRVVAQEKNLSITLDVPPALPPVWGDHDRLAQVLTNLLSNTVKFTEQGHISVSGLVFQVSNSGVLLQDTVEQTLAAYLPTKVKELELDWGAWLLIQVADTGIGIANQDIPLVFERFGQVGDTLTEKPKGTGLGLSICKEIIEYHKGVIWLESELGVGSTFYIAIPAAKQTITAVRQEQPTTRCARQAGDKALILLIDDEPNICHLLNQELSEVGYRVFAAHSGREGLAQAHTLEPDLIILDMVMPDINGYEVAQSLQADPGTADIPIIFVSVTKNSNLALEMGAQASLSKPVNIPQLLQTVKSLLSSDQTLATGLNSE